MAERTISVPAHAKINVFLRVLGRRDDGYHAIESLVLPVSLADDVRVRLDSGDGTIDMRTAAGETVPIEPEQNLAYRAARTWSAAHAGIGAAVSVGVVKRIPVAAGLGGGSADAAAVLRGASELVGEPRHGELFEMAARLGSDVPALVLGGPAIVRGRGEVLEPMPVAPTWWVLLPQSFPVSTPDAYRWWDERLQAGPDPAPLLAALSAGRVGELGGRLFNDLEPGVARRYPEVVRAKEALLDAGALGAVMTGSGPTVAALTRDERHAREVAARVPGAIVVRAPP